MSLPQIALAVAGSSNLEVLNKLDNVASQQGPYQLANGNTLNEIIGTVVSMALSLLGIVFIILMVYAGYNWMTAQGDEEKVTNAKSTIIRAITGVIVVIGAYAIWYFVFNNLF